MSRRRMGGEEVGRVMRRGTGHLGLGVKTVTGLL